MAGGVHLKKKYLIGVHFFLRLLYCGNLSQFGSCNGDAFDVFVPKTDQNSHIYFIKKIKFLVSALNREDVPLDPPKQQEEILLSKLTNSGWIAFTKVVVNYIV